MTVIAVERPGCGVREPADAGAAVLAAFADVTAAAVDAADADELLRLVAGRGCALLGVRRCAVYVRDGDREVFRGRLGHPRDELDESVRRLTMGGPADAITREVLETGAPVLVRDAGADPRAARTAVRAWKVRSLLCVPLALGEEVLGLLVFDDGPQPRAFADADIALAAALGRVAGAGLAQARRCAEQRGRLDAAARHTHLLRCGASVDRRLGHAVLAGTGLAPIVGVLAELTGKPCVLYGGDRRQVVGRDPRGGGADPPVRLLEERSDSAALSELLRDVAAGACVSVEPALSEGVRHRYLLAPVDVRGERRGWLVVMEHPSRLTPLDELATQRTAWHIALELGAQQRARTAAWNAHAALARQLLRGTQGRDELERNAESLGIRLDVPRVVVYLTHRHDGSASLDAEQLRDDLRRRAGGEVLATKGTDGVALLVDVPPGTPPLAAVRAVTAAVTDLLERDGGLLAGVSSVCRDAGLVPRGYREAREVAQCVAGFAGAAKHRILAADDLGPARLFLAHGEPTGIDRFVDDVIGPLLGAGDGLADLLRTLHAFYAAGRSVRLSSLSLGVHENTVRKRLARVQDLTGLDVAADAGDQLSVQTALLVLRLEGHPVLPGFDASDLGAAA